MTALKIALTQLVLCALFGVIVVNGKPPSAVLDGIDADDNEFPYQISLSIFGKHACGGSIIDSRHILTAAHCFNGVSMNSMTITTGTNYLNAGMGDDYYIKNVKIHPGFTNTMSDRRNDIAVVTLSRSIVLDRRRRPVKLPTRDTPVNTQVTACGWGYTYYPNGKTTSGLRKLSMVVVPNDRCRPGSMSYIRDTHICAYSSKGAGLCLGDSGGPLLNNGTLVGITSFLIPCGTGYPDVFTRVHSYVDWINEVTKMP